MFDRFNDEPYESVQMSFLLFHCKFRGTTKCRFRPEIPFSLSLLPNLTLFDTGTTARFILDNVNNNRFQNVLLRCLFYLLFK